MLRDGFNSGSNKWRIACYSLLLIILTLPVRAQQAAPALDAEIATYRELLTEANARIAGLAKRLQDSEGKIKTLEEQSKPPK